MADLTNGGVPQDPEYVAQTPAFDFSVTSLTSGSAVVVVRVGNIPNDAVYRKYTTAAGWFTFDTTSGDTIESGPSQGGSCLSSAGVTYTPGLTAGDDCIRLTIADGGPNDADGATDGAVFDPGVIATPAPAAFVDTRTSGSGGCTLGEAGSARQSGDWGLLALLMVGLGIWRRRHA